MVIKGLHHNAYRCKDSEETRKFYEDFLGLPLVNAFEIKETKTGRETRVLHSFYQMADGSNLAFFHIALEIPHADLAPWKQKGEKAGLKVRGIADHGMIDSIYFRDPSGYVIELTGKREGHDDAMDPAKNKARAHLDNWQKTKPA